MPPQAVNVLLPFLPALRHLYRFYSVPNGVRVPAVLLSASPSKRHRDADDEATARYAAALPPAFDVASLDFDGYKMAIMDLGFAGQVCRRRLSTAASCCHAAISIFAPD